MARPREFDEDLVLDRALSAFWARGYDATSIEDLVRATGLGRASLYGAFGDKEQLFQRVVGHYVARSTAEIERITAGLRGRKALEAFLLSRASSSACDGDPRGCFLQIAATTGTTPPLVEKALAEGNADVHGHLLRYLTEAQELCELSKKRDPKGLVGFIGIFTAGLTASAKSGASPDALAASVRSMLRALFDD